MIMDCEQTILWDDGRSQECGLGQKSETFRGSKMAEARQSFQDRVPGAME